MANESELSSCNYAINGQYQNTKQHKSLGRKIVHDEFKIKVPYNSPRLFSKCLSPSNEKVV